MSKRKLTADDKKSVMIKLLQDKKEFYSLKELEKLVPKETGINEKLVKDVLQKVVDDGAVETEKVGGTILYWSLANKGKLDVAKKCETLKQKVAELDEKIAASGAKKKKVESQEGVEILQTENKILFTKVTVLNERYKLQAGNEPKENISAHYEEKKEAIPVSIFPVRLCNPFLFNIFGFLEIEGRG